MFKQISPETWERREHFEYFTQTIKCGYSLTAELDVTEFLKLTKNKGLRFYPSFVYCVSTVINHMKEFRMMITPFQTHGQITLKTFPLFTGR